MAHDNDTLARAKLPAGTQLNGIYEIDKPIAAGGMGEVYIGHEIQNGHRVAIKVIKSDLVDSEMALALFRKEASALRDLNSEAIVRYFVYSIDPVIKRDYLAMEYVEGPSIESFLDQRRALSVEDVRALARRVALGLNSAHEMGIVHRDISPDNIVLPQGDTRKAKIIDFGITRSIAAAAAR